MRRQAFGLVGSAKGRTADGSNQRFEARHLQGDLFPANSTNQNLPHIVYNYSLFLFKSCVIIFVV